MNNQLQQSLVAIALLATVSPYCFADIDFIVTGIQHDKGSIDIRIFRDAESWLKNDQILEHIIIPAKKGDVSVTLKNFKGGKLAASVYHDENGDGKLNTGLFWHPKEGFAFSNNYKPRAMPQFSKAAIQISDGENISVRLNY